MNAIPYKSEGYNDAPAAWQGASLADTGQTTFMGIEMNGPINGTSRFDRLTAFGDAAEPEPERLSAWSWCVSSRRRMNTALDEAAGPRPVPFRRPE